MKISKQQLIDMGASYGCVYRFIKQNNDTDKPAEIASLIGGEDTYTDLLWLAGELGLSDRLIRFICDCALINLPRIQGYCSVKDYALVKDALTNPRKATSFGDAYEAAGLVEDMTNSWAWWWSRVSREASDLVKAMPGGGVPASTAWAAKVRAHKAEEAASAARAVISALETSIGKFRDGRMSFEYMTNAVSSARSAGATEYQLDELMKEVFM